jgi:hypothetical protein
LSSGRSAAHLSSAICTLHHHHCSAVQEQDRQHSRR